MRRLLPLLLVLSALLLAGCGDDGGGGDGDAAAVTEDDLDGTTWVSTNVAGHDLVEGTQVTMSFEDGNLGLAAGCNQMSGGYEIVDSRLELAGELASTMMGCDGDLQAQDEWLAGLLADGADLTLAGGLIVVVDEVEIELVEQDS